MPTTSAAPAATSPAASVAPSVGLQTTHAWIDTLDGQGQVLTTGDLDTRLDSLVAEGLYRVWFQVVNGTDIGIDIGPLLTSGQTGGSAAPAAVPAPDAVAGQPFFVTAAAGTSTAAPSASLRLITSIDAAGTAVDGLLGAGLNPAGTLALPAHSFTEVGFTISVTDDAVTGSDYSFTLTDGGVALAAAVTAEAGVAAAPSPTPVPGIGGQVVGKPVPLYALTMPLAEPLAAEGPGAIHFSLDLATDTCASCHKTHTGVRSYLGSAVAPISNVCFTCHNATNLPALNVQGQFTSAPVPPANNPATGAYYSHPSTTLSNHTTDREDEFSGRVNRHSECADCHQPHNADTTPGQQTTSGWTASGATKGASGVSVVNSSAAGAAPTYTWKNTSTLEYQLCFKCHSGFTTLTAVGARDKGIEFNPANGSLHPIEGAGRNATAKMGLNLSATHTNSTDNPYKLWAFTTGGTVRCTQCHATQRVREPSGAPAADANLSPHTSSYEGILIANYRRTPRTSEGYAASDFALCYLCHSDRGINGDNNYTNFPEHQLHVRGLGGSLNAVCSECHYQIHSTTLRPTAQTGSTSRLVVFSPNVTASGGVIRYNETGNGAGNCTLTCHGTNHNPESYP